MEGEYKPLYEKWCYRQYGLFTNLLEAKEACFYDGNCKGVYDNKCDGAPHFRLCHTEHEYDNDNHRKSCIHTKTGSYFDIIHFSPSPLYS